MLNLKYGLPTTAFAFRGYNVTNLGRSYELLTHPLYGPVVSQWLEEGSRICAEVTGGNVDLVERVRRQEDTSLDTYAEAIALIVALEQAQLQLLREFHEVDFAEAQLCFGFSLGEISALVACGVFRLRDALRIPLMMAADAADLAHDVTMGILFSRGEALPLEKVHRLCVQLNSEGEGIIGVSTYLSPNSLLLLGTGRTIGRFKQRMKEILPRGLHLRRNEHRWPPLHTPIVWARNISNRAGTMLHTLPGGLSAPRPPVLSLVTGKVSYNEYNARELVHKWIDHPQRLWDAVAETLAMGVETVVHVGPGPNIIPATFDRLAANVEAQTRGSRRMRALSAVIRRPWLQALLPKRASLLRAPLIEHVMLEDWLLQQTPAVGREPC